MSNSSLMVKDVSLSSISMFKNYRDVEPPTEKDADVIELADSVKKHGIMQAVLLREDPAKKGFYQLIFGHRRYLAAKVAGLKDIPSTIKEVADDDILELQVTENLQRKDVHPMDEAVAFKTLHEQKKYSIEEIAARFAKKPEYITQRMSFNSLIPDLQKAFKKNTFLVGHAILISRLTAEDQKELTKKRGGLGTVKDLQDYIDRNISRDLSKANFKTDDPTLFPQAGPCTTCTKRSGCNKLLFSDIKDDRCFDKECFSQKQTAYYVKQIQEIIETKPEIKFVAESHSPIPQSVNKLLQQHKIPLLRKGDQYSEYTWTGSGFKIKAQAFYVNGYDAGKIKTVYLPGKAKDEKKLTSKSMTGQMSLAEKKELIKGIQDREKRAKELDAIKIHAATINALEESDLFSSTKTKFQPIDRGIMIFLLLEEKGYTMKGDVKRLKDFPKEPTNSKHQYHHEYFQKLAKIPDDQLAFIIRNIAWDKLGSRNLQFGIDTADTVIRILAEYAGIDVKKIEKDQADIAAARQERVKKRIADLNVDKKESVAPKKKEPATKAQAKKTATKKSAKKK